MTTYTQARSIGYGGKLTDGRRNYVVSDWSPNTSDAYGWPINTDGSRGDYQKLPEGLKQLTVV